MCTESKTFNQADVLCTPFLRESDVYVLVRARDATEPSIDCPSAFEPKRQIDFVSGVEQLNYGGNMGQDC